MLKPVEETAANLAAVLRAVPGTEAELVARALRRGEISAARGYCETGSALSQCVAFAGAVETPDALRDRWEVLELVVIAALQGAGLEEGDARGRVRRASEPLSCVFAARVLRALAAIGEVVECRARILGGYVPGYGAQRQEEDLLTLDLVEEHEVEIARRTARRAERQRACPLPHSDSSRCERCGYKAYILGDDAALRIAAAIEVRAQAAGPLSGYRGEVASDEDRALAGWRSVREVYPRNLSGPSAEVVRAWAQIFASCAESRPALRCALAAAASQGVRPRITPSALPRPVRVTEQGARWSF